MTREGFPLPKTYPTLNNSLYSGNVLMVRANYLRGEGFAFPNPLGALHVEQEVHDVTVLD